MCGALGWLYHDPNQRVFAELCFLFCERMPQGVGDWLVIGGWCADLLLKHLCCCNGLLVDSLISGSCPWSHAGFCRVWWRRGGLATWQHSMLLLLCETMGSTEDCGQVRVLIRAKGIYFLVHYIQTVCFPEGHRDRK